MSRRLKAVLVYLGILRDQRDETDRGRGVNGIGDMLTGALGLAIILGALIGIGALGGHRVDGDELTSAAALVAGVLLAGLARLAWLRSRSGGR